MLIQTEALQHFSPGLVMVQVYTNGVKSNPYLLEVTGTASFPPPGNEKVFLPLVIR